MPSLHSNEKRESGSTQLTRRELMGSSVLGAAALMGTGAASLRAASAETTAAAHQARRQGGGRRIIDAHVHLWDMPRDQPPMSDFATYPPVDGTATWMAVDRLI